MNVSQTNGCSVTDRLPKRTFTFLPARPDAPPHEYVYFMYSAGRVKIGYSRGTDGRHKQLISAGPFPPVIILMMHGTIGDEQDLHIRFRSERLHGEWFSLSANLRDYLKPRLCDIGRDSLDRAEANFRLYCEEFLGNYKLPPRRSGRKHCDHGMPVGSSYCASCERSRDLKILESINNGTYDT